MLLSHLLLTTTPQEAKRIGEEFLALEKYVNVNYMVRKGCVCVRVCWGRRESSAAGVWGDFPAWLAGAMPKPHNRTFLETLTSLNSNSPPFY